jgi:PAS domain S-box-containing protein
VTQRTAELTQANDKLHEEITQRQRVEEALRASEAEYRDLVESANSPILQLDTKGRITYLNPFACQLFGYAADELLGRNAVGTIVPDRDAAGQDLAAKLRDVVRHPERYTSSENENLRRDGERLWVAWTNRGMYDRDGTLREVLCIGIDRTEERRAEEALRRQSQEAAVAAERNRLARDLHDAVTQTLFSASLIAEVLPRIWERSPTEGRRRLEELRQLTRGALAEMRTLLLELRPTALVEAKLGDLLRQLGEATTGRARVPVTVEVDGQRLLPPEVQVALYRIAQEALNNVAKHARASHVTVRLSCQERQVSLCIVDDGVGFDESAITRHLGMGIMRERAETIGAQLGVSGAPGKGASVAVCWSDDRSSEQRSQP